jgi:ribosomal protein L7/L12
MGDSPRTRALLLSPIPYPVNASGGVLRTEGKMLQRGNRHGETLVRWPRKVTVLEQAKPLDPEIVADAQRLVAVGADRETILVFLRDRKLGKIDSIKIVRILYALSMSEAKDLVDNSAAWSDWFQSDMKFRETALQVLKDLAAESMIDPDLPRKYFLRTKLNLGIREGGTVSRGEITTLNGNRLTERRRRSVP